MEWVNQNSAMLQVALGALTAVIWLAYLQLIYLGFIRQRRAVVMIHHGAADDDRARLTLSNMGSEPVYIFTIIAKITIDGKVHEASVLDREEMSFDDLEFPTRRTNQGPLKTGEYIDVGSFADLLKRAKLRLGINAGDKAEEVELTVGAASGHASSLVVAKRSFVREEEGSRVIYRPKTILTEQVQRSWRRKRALKELGYESVK